MNQFGSLFTYEYGDYGSYFNCKALVQLGKLSPGSNFSRCWITTEDLNVALYCVDSNGETIRAKLSVVTDGTLFTISPIAKYEESRTTFDKFIIHKQSQLTPTSCVPCCIAMITGASQQSIIDQMEQFGDSTAGCHAEFRQWVRMGWLPRTLPYPDLHLGYRNIMLATVPSLNIPGGNHRIVIDYREVLTVHDPNEGREGRIYYTADSLRTWSELTVVEYCFGK